jgi:hypothetical protein
MKKKGININKSNNKGINLFNRFKSQSLCLSQDALVLSYYAISYFPIGSVGLKLLSSIITSSLLKCYGNWHHFLSLSMCNCNGSFLSIHWNFYWNYYYMNHTNDTYFLSICDFLLLIMKTCAEVKILFKVRPNYNEGIDWRMSNFFLI